MEDEISSSDIILWGKKIEQNQSKNSKVDAVDIYNINIFLESATRI